MPLKNGNTVGVERRMDLASLFCMIGRHGPAVALAVIAMVSVLAGIIIYRTVRGKRRKAAAADGDGTSPGAERDASVIQQSSSEESHSPDESTDVSDEGSSDVKEDVYLIQGDLKIRHRRAAPEKTPPPFSPPESDSQVPDNKHTTSDDTEEVAVVRDSYEVAETYAEEATQSLQSEAYTEAEMLLEDVVDCQDVFEEIQDNDSCLNEPGQINDENHGEEEKVSKAECQEDEEVTTDEEVSDKTTREEEHNFLCALNNPVCFEQMSENIDDDSLQVIKTTKSVESNSEEPVTHIEDVTVPCVCYGMDEFEEENPDGIDCSSYSGNNRLSPEEEEEEEEEKNESEEAEEECLKADSHDDGLSGITTDAKAQISGNTDFPDLSSDCQHSQKEDKLAPSMDEDTVSTILGPQMLSHETENQPENHVNDTIVILAVEHNDPLVQCCYEDEQDVQMLRNEALDEASIADVPHIVACDGENNTTPVMVKVFHKVSVGADNVTVSKIVEEISHLPFICQYQQSDHVENNETLDETRVDCATDPDACNNDSCTALLMFEEISCPDMLSYSQDQQSDRMENNETLDRKVHSATDAPAGNNGTINSLIMSEELSHPDMSSYKGQQNDQMKNNEDFSEVTTGAAPVMAEDINPPMCFEQFEVRDNDISVAGSVGEESGISSMTVSPDDGNDFDVIFENMVLPVMECDLQAQNSLFADDAAISVIKEDMSGMVFRPYTSHHSQPSHSEPKGWTNYKRVASNEDMFGHEIENSYHRMMDQFTAQIADSATSFTDNLEKLSDMKAAVKVEEGKEKKAGEGVEKEEQTKAEKEKEEDYEKTEISIMEATMDHNEWIMDSTYQALPWMNLSAPSFAQDHTKTNQLPTEECQHSYFVTDTTCVDATDIPRSTEIKQTSTSSLVDENMENNKKVVAVQPMPQNVIVTFRVHYVTQSPYQSVSVTGNQQELGNWKEFIPLERAMDGHWVTVVSLPSESHVEWKFVVVDKGEVCRWEECGNRLLDTGYGDDLLVQKCWGRL